MSQAFSNVADLDQSRPPAAGRPDRAFAWRHFEQVRRERLSGSGSALPRPIESLLEMTGTGKVRRKKVNFPTMDRLK